MAGLRQARAGRESNVLDMPEFTNQFHSNVGQLSYASAMNNCLWDILGKAVDLPVYRILGAYRDRVRAYASSQHLHTVEDFVEDVRHAKSQGFTAYKIHPPWLAGNEVDYKLDIEVAKAVRKTGGDDMALLFDRVGAYTRLEAMKVGRALDELNYVSFEDCLPTDDMEGLAELVKALDVPITMGEFILSPYDYAKYIRYGVARRSAVHRRQPGRDHRRHESRPTGGVFRHAVPASQLGQPAGPRRPLPLRAGHAQ